MHFSCNSMAASNFSFIAEKSSAYSICCCLVRLSSCFASLSVPEGFCISCRKRGRGSVIRRRKCDKEGREEI